MNVQYANRQTENLSSFTHKHKEVPVNTFRSALYRPRIRSQMAAITASESGSLWFGAEIISAACSHTLSRQNVHSRWISFTLTHMCTVMGAGCVGRMWPRRNASFICLTSAAWPVDSGLCVRLPPFMPTHVPLLRVRLLLDASVEHLHGKGVIWFSIWATHVHQAHCFEVIWFLIKRPQKGHSPINLGIFPWQ